jgi:hypothetical protein
MEETAASKVLREPSLLARILHNVVEVEERLPALCVCARVNRAFAAAAASDALWRAALLRRWPGTLATTSSSLTGEKRSPIARFADCSWGGGFFGKCSGLGPYKVVEGCGCGRRFHADEPPAASVAPSLRSGGSMGAAPLVRSASYAAITPLVGGEV